MSPIKRVRIKFAEPLTEKDVMDIGKIGMIFVTSSGSDTFSEIRCLEADLPKITAALTLKKIAFNTNS